MSEQIEDVDNEEESTKGELLPAMGQISFLQSEKESKLYKIGKLVDKSVPEAMEFLVKTMRNPESDPKLAMQAAQEILKLKMGIAQEEQRNALQRLVLEAKRTMTVGAAKIKTLNSDDEDDAPAMPQFIPNVVMDLGNVSGV